MLINGKAMNGVLGAGGQAAGGRWPWRARYGAGPFEDDYAGTAVEVSGGAGPCGGPVSVLFENLKKVKAWVPIDGTYDLGEGPRQFPQLQEELYPLSNCISCTICMEVCPQFNDATGFVGAATIAQVKLFNNNPTGKVLKEERLRALAGDGGCRNVDMHRTVYRRARSNYRLSRRSRMLAGT